MSIQPAESSSPATAVPESSKPLAQGPYGMVGPGGNPMCEECDIEMHPFAAQVADRHISGYGCDGCGWSSDIG